MGAKSLTASRDENPLASIITIINRMRIYLFDFPLCAVWCSNSDSDSHSIVEHFTFPCANESVGNTNILYIRDDDVELELVYERRQRNEELRNGVEKGTKSIRLFCHRCFRFVDDVSRLKFKRGFFYSSLHAELKRIR